MKYHNLEGGEKAAEIEQGEVIISDAGEMLSFMAEAGYEGCNTILIHKESLDPSFFDLSTGIAGEILQKFSNYRMKLSVIGDFSGITSRSLRDFIGESNRTGIIMFVDSVGKALDERRRKIQPGIRRD